MEKIIKILKNIKPDIDVTNNNLIDEEILDSFDIVTIVSAVDEEFDIQITARDIVPENFNSVEAIYNLVKNYGVAIIIFSVLVKLLMIPISIKQQKTIR